MIKVELEIGATIEDALTKLRNTSATTGSDCCCEFSGVLLYNTDTVSFAYKKITGYSKEELEKQRQMWEKEQQNKWINEQNNK